MGEPYEEAQGTAQNAYLHEQINPLTHEMKEAQEKAMAQQRAWHDRQWFAEKETVERQLRAAALEGALRSLDAKNGGEVLQIANKYLAFLKGGS